MQRVVFDGHTHADRNGFVAHTVIVQRVLECVVAVRDRGDGGPRHTLGVVHEGVHEHARAPPAEALDDLAQPRLAGALGGDLCIEVAQPLVRSAHVSQQQLEHARVQAPALE